MDFFFVNICCAVILKFNYWPILFKPINSLFQVKGSIVKAWPYTACGPVKNAMEIKGHIALALRGDCMFAAKARQLQEAGAIGVIFIGWK